jgi:hypothetical protein
MFSKKQLIIISLVLAIVYHFAFYFNLYGPSISALDNNKLYLLAIASAFIMFFLYLGTYWRADLKGNSGVLIFDLLVIWMLICFIRSLVDLESLDGLKSYLFNNYLGISLFPIFFFIVGINIKYFFLVNKIIFNYLIIATLISIFYLHYFELQLFLLMPLFFIIVTISLRDSLGKAVIILISISVIIVSLTNRAGILRILISYSIVIAYYILLKVTVDKRLIKFMVFVILMIPLVLLYYGIKGQSVFQLVLGEGMGGYSQFDPYADTRTFLYYEVFMDLKFNEAFVFGKGLNAVYLSETFGTYGRRVVEVAFLQILLKTGIVGFILYLTVIIIGIFKALGKSNNLFAKSLGLLLVGYVLMLFLENQIAYNLLNVVIWIVVGMSYSEPLRKLTNKEIGLLFNYSKIPKIKSDFKSG